MAEVSHRNGNSNGTKERPPPGWVAHAVQVAGLIIIGAIAWGSMNERVGSVETFVSKDAQDTWRINENLSEIKADLARTSANIEHLEAAIKTRDARLDRITDVLTQMILKEDNNTGMFGGEE